MILHSLKNKFIMDFVWGTEYYLQKKNVFFLNQLLHYDKFVKQLIVSKN
jgi:hypothetical protein